MNKRLLFSITAAIVAGIFVFTGCTDNTENKEITETAVEITSDETAAVTDTISETETETTTEDLKTIGEPSDDENVYKIDIANLTGNNIDRFIVTNSNIDGDSGNLLDVASNDVFESNEKRKLYYDAAELHDDASSAEADETEYTISIEFEGDGELYELHNFPFDDMDSCELHFAEGVAYIVYTSKSTNKEINTKEDELKSAGLESDTETETQNQVENDNVNDNNSVSGNQSNNNNVAVTDAPAAATNVPDNGDDDAGNAENDNGGGDDPNDGCIGGDGEFY